MVWVGQLKPASITADPYNRPRHLLKQSIEPRGAPVPLEFVQRVLAKRKQDDKTQYLVKWQDLSAIYNEWMDEDDLGEARAVLCIRKLSSCSPTEHGR